MTGIFRLAASTRSVAHRLVTGLTHRRLAYAAAAVEEEDLVYWTEWEEEEEEAKRWRTRKLAAAEANSDGGGGRGIQWLFMGGPTAQKHAHATRLAEILDVPYISMGTLVRQELSPRSSLYKMIAKSVNEGKLVPEEIIFGLLSKRLEEGYYDGETGFILDGIPRTRLQAEVLDQMVDIDLVVNFKSAEDCHVKKQIGGDICSHCGKVFDASNTASADLNPCLANRTQHACVQSSAVVGLDGSRFEKMRAYAEQAKLLEDYYRKQEKLLDFQVSSGPGETWRGLLAALHLQHVDAALSPHKLTM